MRSSLNYVFGIQHMVIIYIVITQDEYDIFVITQAQGKLMYHSIHTIAHRHTLRIHIPMQTYLLPNTNLPLHHQ